MKERESAHLKPADGYQIDLNLHELGVSLTLTEPIDQKFVKGVLGELLGTTLFLFITITTVCYTVFDAALTGISTSTPATRYSIAMCFGYSIFVLIYMFESVSGANLNPAVTSGIKAVLLNVQGPLQARSSQSLSAVNATLS